jgi:cytoskeleton protein RodZ
MTSIGESLRRERLRRNLQLDQVSGELKISPRMLAAIEAEDFQKLPGGVFAKAFVRQYAHFLGLDEEEMATEVDRTLRPETAADAAKPGTAAIPLPRMDSWQSVADDRHWNRGWSASLPALIMVVVVMLVCSAVYAFLQRPRSVAANRAKPVAQHVTPAPQPQAPPPVQASAPAVQPEPATAGSAKESAAATPAAAPPDSEAARTAPQSPTAAGTQPASAAAASAPASPGPIHVQITATEPVWVRATIDGKTAFAGTLAANQSRTVDGKETIVLRLGNAGGVTVLWNGKPIGDIGPKGQIRNVQFTSGGFQIVAPKSAPVDPL